MVVGFDRWLVVLKKFITISKKGWQVGQYVDGQLAIANLPWTKLAAFGCHSSMWPNATTLEREQIGHSIPEAVTVIYGQRPQYLKGHSINNTWQLCIQVLQFPKIFKCFDHSHRELWWSLTMSRLSVTS